MRVYLEDGLLRGEIAEANPDHDVILVSWMGSPLARYRRTDRTTDLGLPIYEFAGEPDRVGPKDSEDDGQGGRRAGRTAMIEKPAVNVRGHLINAYNDGTFVFRVYGEYDPVTGRKTFTDYALKVDDLPIEIMSACYRLYTPAPGEPGTPYLGYKADGQGGPQ
jgi:hypothetical protein